VNGCGASASATGFGFADTTLKHPEVYFMFVNALGEANVYTIWKSWVGLEYGA
jgi:hypothetical protein